MGVTAPEGFTATGVGCGIREEGRPDLGILLSHSPTEAAAVYTSNVVQAAPLTVARGAVDHGDVRAVVVNSGNANACTGRRGLQDAYKMQEMTAEQLELEKHQVAVASTGVIGEYLPMKRIEAGIRDAVPKLNRNGEGFAEAILTTDTVTKQSGAQIRIQDSIVTIGGTAKGSGMIHPNMATMLAFITTDAAVEKEALQTAVSRATDRTFNRITVDGDTSTNDMVLLLANGAAGNELLTVKSPDYPAFYGAVEEVMRDLAIQIARDGEGATKLIEAVVEGAPDEAVAAAVARSIVGSSLVKTAIFGEDANWGRVIAAMGYAGVDFDPDGVELYFGPVKVFADGEPLPHDPDEAASTLKGDEVQVTARLNRGEASATAWGCDLTYEYVKINGSYRT